MIKWKHKIVTTTSYVDLEKYMGVWYEIGRYPCWFEWGASKVKVTYTLCDGCVEVLNQCIKMGKQRWVTGKAYILPNSGNAKLKVYFRWPLRGDYWIIDKSEDYTWAVVSDSKQRHLWILYRQPYISDEVIREIARSLTMRGFNSAKIIWTRQ